MTIKEIIKQIENMTDEEIIKKLNTLLNYYELETDRHNIKCLIEDLENLNDYDEDLLCDFIKDYNIKLTEGKIKEDDE